MSRTVIVVVSVLLAACNLPSANRQADRPQLGTIVVVAGESLSDVARRAGVTVDDLARENSLRPPYRLSAGQVLQLPGDGERYVVRRGDTLSGIANRLDVDMQEMARLNGLDPPYRIYAGEVLNVPGAGGTTVAAGPYAAPPPPANAAWGSVISGGPAVGPGQAAVGQPVALGQPASSRPTVEVTTLPPLAPPAAEQADDAEEAEAAAPPPPLPPPPEPLSMPEMPELAEPAAAEDPGPAAADASPATGQTAALPPAPPAEARQDGGARFQWPVRGEIVSGYGAKPDGGFNEGLNIAAPAGAPVRAAGDGEVVYAGNELRGYGNLVLVRHDNGWITAYAHLDRVLVRRGQRVGVGETIATVGTSGSVSEPQLHFEVRQGTGAVDPGDFLPPL